MKPTMTSVLASVAIAGLAPGVAAAQYFDDTDAGFAEKPRTPETWAFELRLGTYQPAAGPAFDTYFSGDTGPMLQLEVDFLFFEIDGWFDLGVGTGWGWAHYEGKATAGGAQVEETTTLTLYPIPALAVLRIDALARQLAIPLLIAGKVGADFVVWNSGTGNVSEATNTSIGFRWAIQFALELDIFSRKAARALDEEWGINHTYLMFELFGSTASTTLPVGPAGGVAWSAGLGFLF